MVGILIWLVIGGIVVSLSEDGLSVGFADTPVLPTFARRPSMMALMFVTGSTGLCKSGFVRKLCTSALNSAVAAASLAGGRRTMKGA